MSATTSPDHKFVFICGSALRGQPDHGNLQSAEFMGEASTKPLYRLHSVKDGWHPGIHEVETDGISIPGEVYKMTLAEFDQLAAGEPPNMYPHEVPLADGSTAIAFLYPKALIDENGWPDISHLGGWANYKKAGTTEA